MQLSRREMLKLGILGSAALMLPLERVARGALLADRIPESQLPAPFQVPFRVPPVLQPVRRDATTDYYLSRMRYVQTEILPGMQTGIFGYNGVTPGPTIRATRGRRVVVRHINKLPSRHPWLGYETTTSVHLHGNASEPQYDGWANDVTRPGFYKDYVYPNDQDERTLWYHDHAVHHTAQNAYMGLAAFYISSEGLNLPLPKGKYDVPLMIQDKIFAQDGSLIYDESGEDGDAENDSLYGDVILANGKPWPVMKVERRKYLFRILNASVSRSYNLALSSGEPFTVVATDGGLMPVPQQTRSFRLGMAERYAVVIDFAKYRIGDKVVLRNLGLDNNLDFNSTRQIMRFDVASAPATLANNRVPDVLSTNAHPYNPMNLTEADAVRTRDWLFERDGGQWTINGLTWDPNRSDANVGLDDVEIWRLTNDSGGWFHPVHIHLIDFKVLDRNGEPPLPYERGPKDVVYVGEHETVRVIAKFGPRVGKYMMHCHNLVHEDHDMMTNFEVGTGGPDPSLAAPARPLPAPPL
jgi:FtsP/CotA-like multicopper oxidase with cupredoxin domain